MLKYLFKNKIYIKMIGGLGNQLFIYSFGVATSIKYGKELIIDNVSGFSKRDFYKAVSCLEDFNIQEKFLSHTKYKYFIGNRYFWFLLRKLGLCQIENNHEKYEANMQNNNKSFFHGYWQSHLYFHTYKEIIKKSLVITDPTNPIILKYSNKILGSINSVALGMRFYDDNNINENKYKVLEKVYYKAAMEMIKSMKREVTFFVFSLNITRAKKLLSNYLGNNIFFINPQTDYKNARLDLHLMSLCDHFIISNSTMYWWAAYLGEKKRSITIAPKEGFPNKDILLPHWIKI